ncbi:MAG: UDP-N-acetylmuramate--L-alanine ligase [Planctomycetota bacterium]|jgi:UDP-N-acetylmuramate--alanine ligase
MVQQQQNPGDRRHGFAENQTDILTLSDHRTLPPLEHCKVHMVGIGGCGMSGAAGMLLTLGAQVTGSDLSQFAGMGPLVSAGARVTIGHEVALLPADTDLVVMSAAVPETNPELVAARHRGLPVIKYAELLGELMKHRVGIGIAGTHGKTTTTAMCAYLLSQAGLSPSFIFGANSQQLGGHSGVGEGPHFVVESCEFDRSFHHLHPQGAAILNIESDHVDCFGSLDDVVGAFSEFASHVDSAGLLVCNEEDPHTRRMAEAASCTVETVGFAEQADWRAINLCRVHGCYRFDVLYQGSFVLSTELGVPGRYNVSNALAAVALAIHYGATPASVGTALKTFAGVQRRMSVMGKGRGVTVIDDYAHHPTEVRVTLEAARHRFEPKRTLVVFQPHQYARTCHLMDEFAGSFAHADKVIIPDIYAAREPGARAAEGAAELATRICNRGGVAEYMPTLEEVAAHVISDAREGDLLVTMGAGDVWKVADELVEHICRSDSGASAAVGDDVVSPGGSSAIPVPTN